MRIGRRVRIRRTDLDRILAQGTTVAPEPPSSSSSHPAVAAAEARELMARGIERARRLLARGKGARRSELAEGLQELADTVAAGLVLLTRSPHSASRTMRNSGARRPRCGRRSSRPTSRMRPGSTRADPRRECPLRRPSPDHEVSNPDSSTELNQRWLSRCSSGDLGLAAASRRTDLRRRPRAGRAPDVVR